MNKKEQTKDKIIDDAAYKVWAHETIKRLKGRNRFLNDCYAAMRTDYTRLLVEKYRISQIARKLADKLRRQRTLHKKNYAWLWQKYRQAKKRCETLEVWKARGYKRLKARLKGELKK
jgi:hypothetical protein